MGERGAVHGVVLTGTYASRGSGFETLLKDPLAPVAQRPLISYVLRWLREGRVERATLCVNAASRAVRSFLGDGAAFGLELDYSQDDSPRGAAGCVRDAGLAAGADTLVVAEGALIPSLCITGLLEAHRACGAVLSVVVDQDRRRSGMGGERPPSPAGIYVFERRALDWIPPLGFQDIKEGLIPRLHQAGENVRLHVVPGISMRILNGESYVAVNEWMLRRVTADGALDGDYLPWHHGNAAPSGDVLVHASARTALDARLLGPVVLGPDVRVLSGATIVGPTSIGAGSTVGHKATVCRSVVWQGCVIGARAVVDRSLLTDGAAVEPGAMLFGAVRLRHRGKGREWLRRLVPAWAQSRDVTALLPQSVPRRTQV